MDSQSLHNPVDRGRRRRHRWPLAETVGAARRGPPRGGSESRTGCKPGKDGPSQLALGRHCGQPTPLPGERRVSRVLEAEAMRVAGRDRAGLEPQAANRPSLGKTMVPYWMSSCKYYAHRLQKTRPRHTPSHHYSFS